MSSRIDIWALMVAGLGIIALAQMIRTGSGAPNGIGFMRDDEPKAYWTIFVAIALAIIGLIYAALVLAP